MGAKATKMEGEYLPDTPTLNKMRLASEKQENVEMTTPTREQNNALLDPRSPNGCRTPLNFVQSGQQKPRPEEAEEQVATSENAFAMLRKRLLKGFSLNDPRSPQLNRTPLVLDEVRSLNLDDTFADLFVDTRAGSAQRAMPATPPQVDLEQSCDSFGTPPSGVHNNSSLEIVSLPFDEEETLPCEHQLLQKRDQDAVKMETPPPAQQLHSDPRSPSMGVDRTPIIFCDDEEEEAREAQMLEHILETLTLNLSTGSSLASFAPGEEQPSTALPANKHLERVRLGHKRRVPPRKPARANKPKIYVDQEEEDEQSPVAVGSITPKSNSTPLSAQKRTPLSCVKNKPHLRSRSVEKDLRKTQNPPVQSFNDQLRLISGGEVLNGPIY
ncbi:uncharacterized protein LOC128263382 [Drosophila gunungcola]|uniref:uncharacterized protein LOC128263382 n=1 Tax=Drosophila gunungcola TaxID=103775 RepID=UPI0022DEA597|nr:uncharacterized protein LOC128263382 [Drosophila gunungcola]